MHADEDPRSNRTLRDIETPRKSVDQSQQHRKEATQSTPTAPSHYFTPLTENTASSEQALLNQREKSRQALFKPGTRVLSKVQSICSLAILVLHPQQGICTHMQQRREKHGVERGRCQNLKRSCPVALNPYVCALCRHANRTTRPP